MRSTELCCQNVLVSSAELLVVVWRLEASDTHSSSIQNPTSISWIQWLGKRQRSWSTESSWRASMPQRQAQTGSLGKRARGYGNPSVSMATAVLTELLPPHLGKYPTIRMGHVLLYVGWIIKYSRSVADSLLLPPYCSMTKGQLHQFYPSR